MPATAYRHARTRPATPTKVNTRVDQPTKVNDHPTANRDRIKINDLEVIHSESIMTEGSDLQTMIICGVDHDQDQRSWRYGSWSRRGGVWIMVGGSRARIAGGRPARARATVKIWGPDARVGEGQGWRA